MSEREQEAWMAEVARIEIDRRTEYATRMYFNSDPSDDKLATIASVKRLIVTSDRTTHDITTTLKANIHDLERRLAQLERPWWRRWLNR